MKKYLSCAEICILLLFFGVLFSIPLEVHSTGPKPPLLFSLSMLFLSLVLIILSSYITYTSWFQSSRTQARIVSMAGGWGRLKFVTARNGRFLLWFGRIASPLILFIGFTIFLLVALTAF